MFSFFHLLHSNVSKVARAIFYTHQTSGACAGVCACNRTHKMNKTASIPLKSTENHNFSDDFSGSRI